MDSVIISAISACIAEAITYPLDTIKTRLQTNLKTIHYNSLYKGIRYALLRQSLQCSVNLPLYTNLKKPNDSYIKKMCIGSLSGAMGAMVALPTDVLKIRNQTGTKLPTSIKDYYRGLIPACTRSAIIHSTGMVSYDNIKKNIKYHTGTTKEPAYLHIICSFISGIISGVSASPLDVIKTRVMNSPVPITPLQATKYIIKNEGILGFYHGLSLTIIRYLPWSIIWLSSYEQITIAYKGSSNI